MTPPSPSRPAFLIAALAAMTPAVGFADTGAAGERSRAIVDAHDTLPGAVAIGLAASILLAIAALLATGRIGWRRGVMIAVGCCLLFGGGAIIEGFQTAIAVSQ